ncbi:hypothetical protein T439DRAFT_377971 [Meredithblackwellia eburnea MCA 4105]
MSAFYLESSQYDPSAYLNTEDISNDIHSYHNHNNHYNSLQHPITSSTPLEPSPVLARDGRLKNKLMGVGSDGGFLTSPMVIGNSRMGTSLTGGPANDIQIASPATSQMGRGDSSYGGLPLQNSMGESGGMGIGITGVSELPGGLEMGDYGNSNLRIFGMPKSRDRTTSAGELGYLPYPEHMPTTTLGRGKNNLRDVSHAHPPVPERFKSPPPQAAPLQPPATARRSTNRKNLTVKTLNKSKSLSALNQHPSYEPLTPVSAHGPNFFNLPGAPFNSNEADDGQPSEPAIMPLAFADLYNIGLGGDSVDEIDPRKSPMAFVQDLLQSPGTANPQSYTEDADYSNLHSLPTPYLAHSGFSSPSTSYLSDPSPELAQQTLPLLSPGQLSSTSMISAPSMEQQFSIPFSTTGPPPPSTPSRQRCVSYASHHRGPMSDPVLDPTLLTGGPSMQRHVSSPGYAGTPRFAYPTRFSSDQGQTHVGPYLQQHQQAQQPQAWSNDQVAATYGFQPDTQHNLFQVAPADYGISMGRNMSRYEQNLETFEDMYEQFSQASGQTTPGKRVRDDEDDDATPGRGLGVGLPGSATPRKKLRTVASAPILGSPRRMRPGPKPKVTKSPQEACQSVFSANLSPPPIQFRRGSSPFRADGSPNPDYDSDQETFPNGVSAISRDTIMSFYEGVPGHVAPDGTKVPKRYVCLIEGCGRTFPRKSAIESHIQTHLEDKPFVCTQPDCDAAFVRQHDLRRHERIHSGNKPFPCPCGKGFARGDALARHRARGICSGSLVPRRI